MTNFKLYVISRMKSNKIRRRKKKIFMFFKNNSIWIIAVITAIVSLFVGLFKFFEYINATVMADHYGFDISLYKFDDTNYFFCVCKTFITSISIYFIVNFLYKIQGSNKFISTDNLINVFVVFIANYIISIFIFTFSFDNFIINIMYTLFLYLFEYVLLKYYIFIDKNASKEVSFKNNFFRKLESIFSDFTISIICILALFVIFCVCIGINTKMDLSYTKTYRMIGENKAIVYSNNDYYITLKCEIENNVLFLYYGKQEKISTDNIYTEEMKFEDVKFK